MTSQIELKEMKFYAYHGVAEQERQVGNTFVVNLTLTAPLEQAIHSDCIDETINYATLYELVKQEMEQPSRLLEHVAGRILQRIKQQFPQIEAIELKVSKLNPPFGGDLLSASVILKECFPTDPIAK